MVDADEFIESMKRRGIAVSSVGVNVGAVGGRSSAAGFVAKAMEGCNTESEFQSCVVNFAQSLRWKVAHCRKAKLTRGKKTWYETTMPAGWFDLVLVGGVAVFAELKVRPNTPTKEQKEWHAAMRATGQDVRVWYPENAAEIVSLLTLHAPKS